MNYHVPKIRKDAAIKEICNTIRLLQCGEKRINYGIKKSRLLEEYIKIEKRLRDVEGPDHRDLSIETLHNIFNGAHLSVFEAFYIPFIPKVFGKNKYIKYYMNVQHLLSSYQKRVLTRRHRDIRFFTFKCDQFERRKIINKINDVVDNNGYNNDHNNEENGYNSDEKLEAPGSENKEDKAYVNYIQDEGQGEHGEQNVKNNDEKYLQKRNRIIIKGRRRGFNNEKDDDNQGAFGEFDVKKYIKKEKRGIKRSIKIFKDSK